MRVLVTGSRDWRNTVIIRDALARVWHPEAVLVTGRCPRGADALAEACWRAWGGVFVDPFEADWDRYGRAAGPIRNRAMVAAGADVCLAFLLPGSVGGATTAQWAHEAGIPTELFPRGAPWLPRLGG